MWEDHIVKEIHEHRQAMLDRFNGDLKALFNALREQQERSGRKIVCFTKPKPVEL